MQSVSAFLARQSGQKLHAERPPPRSHTGRISLKIGDTIREPHVHMLSKSKSVRTKRHSDLFVS
jgi:hypothetical protein